MKRFMTKSILSGLLFFLSVVGQTKEPMPLHHNWILKDLQGHHLSLSDYQGKPVILVFWATWCPYCKKLLPGLNRVYEKYKADGFILIGMNIMEDGEPDAYMKARGYNFKVALDSDDIASYYGVRGTPTTVFIDKSGDILGKVNISDPNHPVFEAFVREQLGLTDQIEQK